MPADARRFDGGATFPEGETGPARKSSLQTRVGTVSVRSPGAVCPTASRRTTRISSFSLACPMQMRPEDPMKGVAAMPNDDGPRTHHAPDDAEMGRETGRRRILVAEDDPQMRALFAAVLRQDGADVVEAEGGAELLEWAERAVGPSKRAAFDAIISDIQMPNLTALDVIRRIPAVVRNTPVILVSAFGDAATRRTAYDLGVELVLSKPLDPHDLRAVARGVTRRSVSCRVNAAQKKNLGGHDDGSV